MICTVEKIVFGGSALAKIDGKTVFVSGALPGETVEIEIVENKKDYCKAKTVRIIDASPYRQKSMCSCYEVCGGCNMQHAFYTYQLKLKKDIMIDCFTRNGIGNMPTIQTVFANDTEYRNRFQFSYGGLKSKKSNEIIPLHDCLCGVKEIRTFLQSEESAFLKSHDRLQVFAGSNVKCKVGGRRITFGIDGQSEVELTILGKKIEFDARGFFQSNSMMLEKTIPLVVDGLQGNHLLDMYSGVGTLSLFAKEHFKTVTLVEHNKKALMYAKNNFSINDVVFTYAMSGEQWIKKAKKLRYDAVIIDPPRSGIEKSLLNWLCNEKIKTVRYVSCDVSTMARDVKYLLDAGYTLDAVYFLDFYPHTSHIESLACFTYNVSQKRGGTT